MLHEKNLLKEFYVEATNTSVFLFNRLLTDALEKKRPCETWFNTKSRLETLKVFGCLCFSHIPHVKRDKLSEKVEPRIFLGYSMVSKAYKIYHPHAKKMVVGRDVQFLEDEEWDWTKEVVVRQQEVSLNLDELVDDVLVREE